MESNDTHTRTQTHRRPSQRTGKNSFSAWTPVLTSTPRPLAARRHRPRRHPRQATRRPHRRTRTSTSRRTPINIMRRFTPTVTPCITITRHSVPTDVMIGVRVKLLRSRWTLRATRHACAHRSPRAFRAASGVGACSRTAIRSCVWRRQRRPSRTALLWYLHCSSSRCRHRQVIKNFSTALARRRLCTLAPKPHAGRHQEARSAAELTRFCPPRAPFIRARRSPDPRRQGIPGRTLLPRVSATSPTPPRVLSCSPRLQSRSRPPAFP